MNIITLTVVYDVIDHKLKKITSSERDTTSMADPVQLSSTPVGQLGLR